MTPDPAWLAASDHEGLVRISTHSLYLHVSGPPRNDPSQPVVILEAGGCESGYGSLALAREISKYTRVYWYSRSGFGRSETYPDGTPSSTLNHVRCLEQLLEAAGVKPPFVLCGYSYGGNIVRLFVEEDNAREGPNGVVGVMLLDSPPMMPEGLPMGLGELVGPNGDYNAAIGLKDAVVLSKEDYEEMDKQNTVGALNGAVAAEIEEMRPGVAALNERQGVRFVDDRVVCSRQVLGDRPLCVVKGGIRDDYEKVYNYGFEHGYGSQEAREEVKAFLERWPGEKFTQLLDALVGLSSNCRMVQAEGVGRTHILPLTVPDFIAGHLRWVIGLE